MVDGGPAAGPPLRRDALGSTHPDRGRGAAPTRESPSMAPANSPRIRSAVPTFLVADVAGTAQWYSVHLGFTLAGSVPKQAPYVYASIQRDGAEIMLLSLPGYQKPDLSALRPEGLWDAYFRVNGVHALYEGVRPDGPKAPTVRGLGIRGARPERVRARIWRGLGRGVLSN